jgi:hypothetical protein
MKAAVIPAKDSMWELREVSTPKAHPGEVLINVDACGICFTGVWTARRAAGDLFPKADYKRTRIQHCLKSLVVMAFLMISMSAFAAGPCAGKVTTPTTTQRKMYARSISSNLKGQSPSTIKIDKTLTIDNWTAIWASPKDMEQGVFVYSQEKTGLTFHDVWGGYATPSEKPEIVRWVKHLSTSVPDDFANCFAAAITTGH